MEKTAYDQGYDDVMRRLGIVKVAGPELLIPAAVGAARFIGTRALPWIGRGLLAAGRSLFGRGAASAASKAIPGAAEAVAGSSIGSKAMKGLDMAGNAGMAKSLFERPAGARTKNPYSGQDYIPYAPPE